MKNAQRIVDKFNRGRRLKQYENTHFGGMAAAQLHPLDISAIRPDEGGSFQTDLNIVLAPVSGYLRSMVTVDVKEIFVPYQAIEKLELDEEDDAGVTEMTRRRLLAGQGIGLEDAGTITNAANIHGRSVGNDLRVSKTARLAYLCAVNHLLQVAYYNATTYPKTETAILPAILTANILQRFDGVLEPENLIDGAIDLTGELPVRGIGFQPAQNFGYSNVSVEETGGEDTTYAGAAFANTSAGNANLMVEEDPDNPGYLKVVADLSSAGEITLRDLMKSKKLDDVIRELAGVVKTDPLHGEEAVERALFGIQCDFDDNCHVTYDYVTQISPVYTRPMDGASINEVGGDLNFKHSFSTIVPRSELGGQLVTLVSVKPLEVVANQPNPAQTEAWTLVNRVQDELELDEQLLTRADLESGVAAADADTEAFWVGYNRLKHKYSTKNGNAQQTFGVEMKSTMWTYEIPTSVTPSNVSYPETIDMYPFHYWDGPAADYTISKRSMISTPIPLGPSPVERIQLFADEPDLITG